MEVHWTDSAEKHLDSIYEYIAQDSSYYAKRMVGKLTLKSIQISQYPHSGRVVPEYENEKIREIIESPYRIIYKIKSDQIDILAVIHGARNFLIST